jgi:predicted NBD/HSP70 family sugar kinase
MSQANAETSNANGQRHKSPTRRYPKVARNELGILRLIHAEPKISRIELARQTGLSAALVGGVVGRLVGKGLVVETGPGSTRVGRKPVALSLRNDIAYLVGVDVGSFLLRVVITDFLGRSICATETETRMAEGRSRVLQRTFETIRKTIQDSRLPDSALKGIGIAHSGVIDAERGVVLSFPRPGQMTEWKNVSLKQLVEEEFGLPALLDDSTRMMAIAENCLRQDRKLRDFLFISVSTGIGAAIFVDGTLYRGPGGFAGEFGHMTVDENGPLCCCGNYGCLEALASGGAIIQSVRTAIQKGVDSKVRDLTKEDLDRISMEIVTRAAAENDGLACRVLHDAVSHIAVALADVVNLLSPRVIILGGPLFRLAPQLITEPLMRVVKQRAFEKSANEIRLEVSSLGSEAAALGAARLIAEAILERVYLERV